MEPVLVNARWSFPRNLRSRAVTVLLMGSVVMVGGCSEKMTRTFGLTRDSPDEYTVTTRAPLSLPPDYALRPPRPGAPRPQEQSDRQQAAEALVPQLALNTPQGSMSAGQSALLQQVGPAPANVRSQIDRDAINANNTGFVDDLLYWRKPDVMNAQVDAQKESQRLRQNSALGEPPNVGDTPIILPKKSGWFSNLFSWM